MSTSLTIIEQIGDGDSIYAHARAPGYMVTEFSEDHRLATIDQLRSRTAESRFVGDLRTGRAKKRQDKHSDKF